MMPFVSVLETLTSLEMYNIRLLRLLSKTSKPTKKLQEKTLHSTPQHLHVRFIAVASLLCLNTLHIMRAHWTHCERLVRLPWAMITVCLTEKTLMNQHGIHWIYLTLPDSCGGCRNGGTAATKNTLGLTDSERNHLPRFFDGFGNRFTIQQ